jgi:hypothetical protein
MYPGIAPSIRLLYFLCKVSVPWSTFFTIFFTLCTKHISKNSPRTFTKPCKSIDSFLPPHYSCPKTGSTMYLRFLYICFPSSLLSLSLIASKSGSRPSRLTVRTPPCSTSLLYSTFPARLPSVEKKWGLPFTSLFCPAPQILANIGISYLVIAEVALVISFLILFLLIECLRKLSGIYLSADRQG